MNMHGSPLAVVVLQPCGFAIRSPIIQTVHKKDAAMPLSSTHNYSAAPQCDSWMTSSFDEHPAASGSFVRLRVQKKEWFGDGVKRQHCISAE